ncbi:MAG: TIR domain-containing protein [Candidatus Eisenbacteria bacterium]|uniref:TIR domain-containing protein n=1 Tax=Eiseniibacteriota bacterium TaxID=2212470 RepID=A0A849SN19_UNCEI|nr:TIR domain-containing protein [Candidatus Eisenbacteria bacterium]
MARITIASVSESEPLAATIWLGLDQMPLTRDMSCTNTSWEPTPTPAAVLVAHTKAAEASPTWRERLSWLLGRLTGTPVWIFSAAEDAAHGTLRCSGLEHLVICSDRTSDISEFVRTVAQSYDDSELLGRALTGAGAGAVLTRASGAGTLIGGIIGLVSADNSGLRPAGLPFACWSCGARYRLHLLARPSALKCFQCGQRYELPAASVVPTKGAVPSASLTQLRPTPRRRKRVLRRSRITTTEPTVTTSNYDVALSFAGEQRAYVQRVAESLRAGGASVFFDEFEAVALWGHDLAVRFDTVYRSSARFVVPFVSAAYASKAWPQHEFRSALATAVQSVEPYILPVRFDQTELPGLRPTIHYLDGVKLTPDEVARAILQRLTGETASAPLPSEVSPRLRALPPSDFNPYAETEVAVRLLRSGLERRTAELEGRGFGVHTQDRNGRFMLRIMRSGASVYGLDVWIGGDWGDNTICFSIGASRMSSNGVNATGTVEWDRERGLPLIVLHNMSLLPNLGDTYRLTGDELAEAIWNEICNRFERGF